MKQCKIDLMSPITHVDLDRDLLPSKPSHFQREAVGLMDWAARLFQILSTFTQQSFCLCFCPLSFHFSLLDNFSSNIQGDTNTWYVVTTATFDLSPYHLAYTHARIYIYTIITIIESLVSYQTTSGDRQMHRILLENQSQPTSVPGSFFSLPPSVSLLLFISLSLQKWTVLN